MAASVKVCDSFILLTNGNSILIVPFSCPSSYQKLDIPDIVVKSSVATKKRKSQSDDGTVIEKTSAVDNESPNRIIASAISGDCKNIAIGDDRKYLHVFRCDTGGWRCSSSRCISRRCTTVCFTNDSDYILVADKSGDVFSFPVVPLDPVEDDDRKEQTVTKDSDKEIDGEKLNEKTDVEIVAEGEPEPSTCGELKLGHLSMLLDMMLINKDQYIVTCDRDEKIRLSHYPDAYNIHSYCLGHSAFVSCLTYNSSQNVIFSGSGDCTVRLWSVDGKELLTHNVLKDLPPCEDQSMETENGNSQEEEKTKSELEQQKDKIENKSAVQHLSYCEPCKLLCVTMYRCPTVLIYQVTYATEDCIKESLTPSLKLFKSFTAEGNVVSMDIHKCVLWLLRQHESELKLSAYHLSCKEGVLEEILPSLNNDSTEACVLQKVLTQNDFLKANEYTSDPFPHLWKSTNDSNCTQYKERKQERMEYHKNKKFNKGKNQRHKARRNKERSQAQNTAETTS